MSPLLERALPSWGSLWLMAWLTVSSDITRTIAPRRRGTPSRNLWVQMESSSAQPWPNFPTSVSGARGDFLSRKSEPKVHRLLVPEYAWLHKQEGQESVWLVQSCLYSLSSFTDSNRLIVQALLRCNEDPHVSYKISLCSFQIFPRNRNCIRQRNLFWIPESPKSCLSPSSPASQFSDALHTHKHRLTLHSCLGVLGDKEGSGMQPGTGRVCVSDNVTLITWSSLWPCHVCLVWSRGNTTGISAQRPGLGGLGKVTSLLWIRNSWFFNSV